MLTRTEQHAVSREHVNIIHQDRVHPKSHLIQHRTYWRGTTGMCEREMSFPAPSSPPSSLDFIVLFPLLPERSGRGAWEIGWAFRPGMGAPL